jgi:hypothetical protein
VAVVSALSPISLAQFFYQSGKLVRPARLFFFKPATEDRVTVYTDPALGVPFDQPVLTGGSGRVPPIYVGTEPYRIRVFDSYGSLVEDIDYLPAATSSGGSGGGGGTGEGSTALGNILLTGDYIIAFTQNGTPRAGCVRANGGLIGPGGFTGTGFPDIERLNDDTYKLFKHLWGQDAMPPNNMLQVLPSKGISADDDWYSLGKVIRLPDLRGRALVGLDGMGQANQGRLTGVAITGAQTAPGAYGGAATAVMSATQLPVHTHTLTAAGTGITIATAATGIAIAGSPTGITVAGAVANLAAAATGVYTGGAPTGIGIYANYSGVTIQGAYTGIWTGGAGTGIGIYGAYSDLWIVDPGHSHTYTSVLGGALVGGFSGPFSLTDSGTSHSWTGIGIGQNPHAHGVADPGHTHGIGDPTHTHGVSDPTHAHSVADPWHSHPIGDPTHNHTQTAHVHGISDPWHAHGVSDPKHAHSLTDPTHTHAIATAGSSAALPTTGPFLLSTIYIKL